MPKNSLDALRFQMLQRNADVLTCGDVPVLSSCPSLEELKREKKKKKKKGPDKKTDVDVDGVCRTTLFLFFDDGWKKTLWCLVCW